MDEETKKDVIEFASVVGIFIGGICAAAFAIGTVVLVLRIMSRAAGFGS